MSRRSNLALSGGASLSRLRSLAQAYKYWLKLSLRQSLLPHHGHLTTRNSATDIRACMHRRRVYRVLSIPHLQSSARSGAHDPFPLCLSRCLPGTPRLLRRPIYTGMRPHAGRHPEGSAPPPRYTPFPRSKPIHLRRRSRYVFFATYPQRQDRFSKLPQRGSTRGTPVPSTSSHHTFSCVRLSLSYLPIQARHAYTLQSICILNPHLVTSGAGVASSLGGRRHDDILSPSG